MRTLPSCLASTLLILLLAGCGDDAVSTDPADEGDPASATREATKRPQVRTGNALVGLTQERLDEFVAVLRDAAADPETSAGMLAVKRGWPIRDWTRLHATVSAVAQAGGFDAWLERTRKKSADVETRLAAFDERVAGASVSERRHLQRAAATLRKARDGWQRTLAQADLMRPGGALLDARLDEIRTALGQ